MHLYSGFKYIRACPENPVKRGGMIGRDWLYRWDGPELAPEVAIMTA